MVSCLGQVNLKRYHQNRLVCALAQFLQFLYYFYFQFQNCLSCSVFVIKTCSQTLHVLRVLRAHGMPPSALHEVFRAVVITKLCYASSARWGFSTAGDIQRKTAFIRRSIRQGYCNSDHADITSIINVPTNSYQPKSRPSPSTP